MRPRLSGIAFRGTADRRGSARPGPCCSRDDRRRSSARGPSGCRSCVLTTSAAIASVASLCTACDVDADRKHLGAQHVGRRRGSARRCAALPRRTGARCRSETSAGRSASGSRPRRSSSGRAAAPRTTAARAASRCSETGCAGRSRSAAARRARAAGGRAESGDSRAPRSRRAASSSGASFCANVRFTFS